MKYEDFRRACFEPYWCEGSPLRWITPENIGLSHIALQGNVGVFNISWWLLGRRDPPPANVYKNTNILWAIMVAPYILADGYSLAHVAALKTRSEFEGHLLRNEKRLRPMIAKQGMTWDILRMLTTRGQFV